MKDWDRRQDWVTNEGLGQYIYVSLTPDIGNEETETERRKWKIKKIHLAG